MRTARFLVMLLFTSISCVVCLTAPAEESHDQGRQYRIGHFTVSVPQGWNSFSDTDKAAARREFSDGLAPGLIQYKRAGGPTPHLGEFEIFQKPTDGRLIGWTLVIPDQTDFLKEILKREDVQFEKRKSLSEGRIKAGSCRLVKVSGFDVIRVDVEMANGGKSTKLHFWSPKNPGIISTLMIGVRLHKSPQTEQEFETMISTLVVSEEIKD